MTPKQLAEKVAGHLGYPHTGESLDGTWLMWKDGKPVYINIISWPTVGLAIAQAREWGWSMELSCGEVSFYIRDNFEGTQTNSHDVDKLGDIIAILSAFAQIPKPEGKEA